MDIKSLTTNLLGKTQVDLNVIKPSVASSDQPPHTGNPLSPQTIKAIQAMLQTLQLGKVFDVIITRVEGSSVTLQIPGAPADAPVLQTQLSSPPPIGTRLTLQLTEDTARPELKVIATPNSPQDVVTRNLRTGLQQQKAITPLLANLALLAKTTGPAIADLPEEVNETARLFIQQLSHAVTIKSPQTLKQALRQTGPFLEATLARQNLPTHPKHIPPPTLSPQLAVDEAPVMRTETELNLQARHALATQTVESIMHVIRQQPVPDIGANLLRLASVIRAVNEQVALQKQIDLATAEATQQDNAKLQTGKSTPGQTLPSALTDSGKPLTTGATTTPAAPGKPADALNTQQTAPAGTQAQIQTQAGIRSQTPQPQSAVQASLAGILEQQSALDEILGQVEGALARIQVQQLQMAATEQQHRPVWVMELPVRTEQGIDLFDLRIQRDTENHAADDPRAPWTVNLAFDLEKLGAIHAQVTLYGEDRVSTVFWAEQAETSTYFNQHLDKLEQRFRQVGLEVARLDCRCGKPDSPPPSQEPRLVDEKV